MDEDLEHDEKIHWYTAQKKRLRGLIHDARAGRLPKGKIPIWEQRIKQYELDAHRLAISKKKGSQPAQATPSAPPQRENRRHPPSAAPASSSRRAQSSGTATAPDRRDAQPTRLAPAPRASSARATPAVTSSSSRTSSARYPPRRPASPLPVQKEIVYPVLATAAEPRNGTSDRSKPHSNY